MYEGARGKTCGHLDRTWLHAHGVVGGGCWRRPGVSLHIEPGYGHTNVCMGVYVCVYDELVTHLLSLPTINNKLIY